MSWYLLVVRSLDSRDLGLFLGNTLREESPEDGDTGSESKKIQK